MAVAKDQIRQIITENNITSQKAEVPTRQLYISVSYQRRIFPIDTENFTPSNLFLQKVIRISAQLSEKPINIPSCFCVR